MEPDGNFAPSGIVLSEDTKIPSPGCPNWYGGKQTTKSAIYIFNGF
jgi:hypothetical protein